MDTKTRAEPPTSPHLPPPLRTDEMLDLQLGLLTEVLAERLAMARAAAADPKKEFESRREVGLALQLSQASADLASAKARLRGEVQIRYHVVRAAEDKKPTRLGWHDPAGLEEPTAEEAARRLEQFYARNRADSAAAEETAGGGGRRPNVARGNLSAPLKEPTEAEMAEILSHYPKTPDDPVPFNPDAIPYDPANPDAGGLDPEMPVISQDELTAMDGWYRYSLRWEAARAAKAARLAAAAAAEESGAGSVAAQNEQGGWSPPDCEVQLGKRTGGKRGAPYGNSNRLKHGRWSKAQIADDKAFRALLRQTRCLIIRANMVVRARRAFLKLVKLRAKSISSIRQLLRGPWVLSDEDARQLAHQLSLLNRIAVHDTG